MNLLDFLVKSKALGAEATDRSSGGTEAGGVFNFELPKLGEGLPTDLTDLLDKITLFLQRLAVPVAVAFYLWAAFLYLTSAGEPNRIQQANKAVLYTTVGLIVVLVARGLALVVKKIFAPELPEL